MKEFKDEIFKKFRIESAKRFSIIENIPASCIGKELRAKLHEKTH